MQSIIDFFTELLGKKKRVTSTGDLRRELTTLTEAQIYAELSSDSYSAQDKPSLIVGWKKLHTKVELARLELSREELGDAKTDLLFDFDCVMYENAKRKEICVVFRGTEQNSIADWIADLKQFFGHESSYYSRAKTLAEKVVQSAESLGLDVTFAGHSLGGGLATYGGLAVGKRAFIFNPANLSENHITSLGASVPEVENSPLIRHLYIEGEILHLLQSEVGEDLTKKLVVESLKKLPGGDKLMAKLENETIVAGKDYIVAVPATDKSGKSIGFAKFVDKHSMDVVLTSLAHRKLDLEKRFA